MTNRGNVVFVVNFCPRFRSIAEIFFRLAGFLM